VRHLPVRLLAVLTLASAIACSRAADEPESIEPIGPVVGVVEATVQTIRDVVAVAGQVVPASNTDWTIFAPEPSMIAEMPKMLGEPIAAGDVLVRFEVAALTQNYNVRQAALSDAASRADMARAEVSRLTPLFERGIIPRNDLETARAELASAEAARATAEAYLEEARLLRDATRITARFSGVVAEVWHGPGEFTSGQDTDPVMRVVDPARLEIRIDLPTSQAIRVRESQPATVLTVTAGSFTATVTRRPIGVLIESATTPVRLTAPELSALTLNDVVQVEIVLDERPDAVVVPAEALLRDGTATYLMTADPDGIARRREVRIGLTAGGLVQITEGIQPGELVIVQGLAEVADGTPIIISR
jgi:RND family efflux transporter MFP subunit